MMSMRRWTGGLLAAAVLAVQGAALAQPPGLPAEGVAAINNREYAQAVRKVIQGAKSSLCIMLYQVRYYPEYPQTVTNDFSEDLIAAAQRGVDVRITIDTGDWNPSEKNPVNLDFADRISTAGVKIWEDSPRDVSHQKVIVADDSLTIVASHNWLFYSVANNNEVAVVIDSKPVNQWFRNYFMMIAGRGKPYANVYSAEEAFAEPELTSGTLKAADLGLNFLKVESVLPAANRSFYPVVRDAVLGAKNSITVVQRSLNMYATMPTFDGSSVELLPGEPPSQTNALAELLVDAHKRGVKVTVVLDKGQEGHSTEGPDQTARFFKEHGIAVYQDDPQVQTHAKMLMVDDDKVILGSTNWTYPALESGNEASVLVRGEALNKVFQDYVNRVLQSGAPYEFNTTSIWDSPTTTAQTP